jgi:uncharacterized RDD family membrane protein YckC
MDPLTKPNFPPRAPWLPRLLLWGILVALLVSLQWPRPQSPYLWHLYLAGNPTNLYVMLGGKQESPQGSSESEAATHVIYTRLEADGSWSEPIKGRGDVLHAVAWQEDLAALFVDGGLFAFGPSGRGYISSPDSAHPRSWPSWLAAAVTEDWRLQALGLNGDDLPVFCEYQPAGEWDRIQAVDLSVLWSAATAREMSAAVRGNEFHVVWPTQAVADMPTEQGPRRRWLAHAWRDTAGKWHGPEESKKIALDGAASLIAFDGKLGVLYREASGEEVTQSAGAPSARLAYAEFTKDGEWHVVSHPVLPPRNEGDATIAEYALARSGGRHVLAVRYDDNAVRAFILDGERGTLEALGELPPLAETFRKNEPAFPSEWLMVALLVLATAMFVGSVISRRRMLRRQMADGTMSSEDVARVVSEQVERLMYVPVLIRRSVAAVIDMLLVVLVSAPLAVPWAGDPERWQLSNLGDPPTDEQMVVVTVYYVALCLYYMLMELVWQRTVGKMVCGVRVADLADRRPAWWRIIVRNLFRPVDLFMMLGFVSILWSRRNQSLGDHVAGTRVIPNVRTTSGGPQDSDRRSA